MFRCAVTGKITQPGEPQFKVVVETRPQTYVNFKFDEETLETEKIVSSGEEIVREINVSAEGLAILEKGI